MHRLLVVEDDSTLREALRFNLEADGYAVDVASNAEQALAMELENYSLVLLDIMMGEISGLKMAQIMKQKTSTAHIPIIFCTALNSEDQMVSGLELGADDYITKPYSIRNVMARVKTVLRRTSAKSEKEQLLTYKGLTVNPGRKLCLVDGLEVRLPRKEFEILSTLLRHRGEVFSRTRLLSLIWPEQVVVLERVVDVNITRLRAKLGVYGKNIVTRAGYGYGFIE